MEIPYPTRSKLLETCLAEITSSRLTLLAGDKISITLAPGRNDGKFKVST